jgi:hypothetical protein
LIGIRKETVFDLPRFPAALDRRCRSRRGRQAAEDWTRMTDREFQAKLDELDQLLNDPDIRMDPHRVWTLLAEISAAEAQIAAE